MNKRILLVAAMAAGLGLLAVGCGDSDEATTVSKVEFTSRGNQICADMLEKQEATYDGIVKDAENREPTASDSRAAEQELADAVAASVEEMVADFEDLGVPAGKGKEVAMMLEEFDRGAEETKADPQAFLSTEAFAGADKRARALGLTKCQL